MIVFDGKLKVGETSLEKAEMAYVPRGVEVKMSAEKCLVLVIVSQVLTQADFLKVAFEKAIKDPCFSKPMPHKSLFSGNNFDFSQLEKKFSSEKTFSSLRKRFLKDRIGPLELLQPNEEVVDEEPETALPPPVEEDIPDEEGEEE